ncbi:MAG: Glutathione peroxidase family protein [Myxococcaceae bacterium]|nr:Glutathione peroxidase family protein [Myxococcaceae bacterium]
MATAVLATLAITAVSAGCSSTEADTTSEANPKKTPPKLPDGGTADATPFVCSPAAAPGSLYAFDTTSLGGDPRSMCEFRGRVLLIVNVASACAYTPQYAPLETLYEKYTARGFDVLGFPCNQFGAQESGSSEEISTFCTTKYHVTFPMFAKIEVNGAGADPIYAWLKAQPGGSGDITWNFNKFLIGRDGKLIKRFATETPPDAPEISAAIEAAL